MMVLMVQGFEIFCGPNVSVSSVRTCRYIGKLLVPILAWVMLIVRRLLKVSYVQISTGRGVKPTTASLRFAANAIAKVAPS